MSVKCMSITSGLICWDTERESITKRKESKRLRKAVAADYEKKKEKKKKRGRVRNGVLLFSGGPDKEGSAEQAGGRDVLTLRWWSKRRRHENCY